MLRFGSSYNDPVEEADIGLGFDPDMHESQKASAQRRMLSYSRTKDFRQSGFAPDILIETESGPVAAKDITTSHRVMTLKHGFRPVLWAGRDLCHYTNTEGDAPIRLGAEFATVSHTGRNLMFAPGQHLLLRNGQNDLLFNSNEVLVQASDLVQFCGITEARQRYAVNWVQLLFDRVEIIKADGIWTESMVPDMGALRQNKWALATSIDAYVPQLRYEHGRAAYARTLPVLNRKEVRTWMCNGADCSGRLSDKCPLAWF